MSEPSLEDLFETFRGEGDAEALAALFDRTAAELLTLALHLSPESAAAEDLVQATFLAAIEGSGTFERGRRILPWLVGILANQAARARRDRARVIDPLRVEVRAETDPTQSSEQREVLATLTRAIDELPEACRESVRRHLLEGERAVDIARATGVAPGTVRMQILRGLERLRRTLPASLLSATPILVESSHVSAIRSTVLAAARLRTGSIASPSSSTAAAHSPIIRTVPILGGVIVSMKLCLGLLALLLVLLASWSTGSAPRAGDSASLDRAGIARETSDTSSSMATSSTKRSDRIALLTSPGSGSSLQSGYWMEGEVLGLGALAAEQTTIRVNSLEQFSTHPDAHGHYALDLTQLCDQVPSPEQFVVFAWHPANREANAVVPIDVPARTAGRDEVGHAWKLDLQLEPFVRVTGSVQSLFGEVIEGSWAALYRPEGAGHGLARAEFAKDGTFVMKWNGDGIVWLVTGAPQCLPISRRLRLEPGTTFDAGVSKVWEGLLAIEGQVRLPFACDLARLEVRAVRKTARPLVDVPDGSHLMLGPSGAEVCEAQVRVDSSGAFAFHGLPAGQWTFSLEGDHDLMLQGMRSVTGSVPGDHIDLGGGLSRTTIDVVSHGMPVEEAWFITHESGKQVEWGADGNGRSVLFGESAKTWDLEVQANGFARQHLSIPASDEPVDRGYVVEMVPEEAEPATLELDLSGSALVPDEFFVFLELLGSRRDFESQRFERGPGPYRMRVPVSGQWRCTITPEVKSWLRIGEADYLRPVEFVTKLESSDLQVQPIRFESGGRARFEIEGWSHPSNDGDWVPATLQDASGRIMSVSYNVVRADHGGIGSTNFVDHIPLFADSDLRDSLPPGRYTLTIHHEVWHAPPVQFDVRSGETTTVHVPVTRR